MKITLYGRPFNRSDRVQWTLEELGLDYEYRILDVFALEHRSNEFRAKYGLTRLPFVELNSQVLFESGAIMLHLADSHRDRISLIPEVGAKGRDQVLQWLFFSVSTLEAADPEADVDGEPAPSASQVEVLNFLESNLATSEFIAGTRFSLADIALVTGLQWIPVTPEAHPRLTEYFERLSNRPARQRVIAQAGHPLKP